MEPDLYQKRPVSQQEVIESISLDPEAVSRIILAVSPVRSGSTALLRVFAAAGVEAHFQELKNTLRWLMQGETFHWVFSGKPNQVVLLKETLGPYTEAESLFNPLEILLGAGIPPEKIHLVIVGREPLQTWASWDALWGKQTRVELFVQTYRTMEKIRRQAEQKGIASTCLAYEVFKDQSAEIVVRRLFQRLGLTYTVRAIQGWDRLPAFGAPGSNIVFPEEPDAFSMPTGLASIKQSNRFHYASRERDLSGLKKSDIIRIARSGLFNLYEKWIGVCEEDLELRDSAITNSTRSKSVSPSQAF